MLTKHHVPPKSKRRNPKFGFILRKPWHLHKAYHDFFGVPSSFHEALEILIKRWNDETLFHERQLLFGNSDLAKAGDILLYRWWTPKDSKGNYYGYEENRSYLSALSSALRPRVA